MCPCVRVMGRGSVCACDGIYMCPCVRVMGCVSVCACDGMCVGERVR